MPEPVRATVSVAFTWPQDVLDTIAIEPRAGGLCFERGPHGFHSTLNAERAQDGSCRSHAT